MYGTVIATLERVLLGEFGNGMVETTAAVDA